MDIDKLLYGDSIFNMVIYTRAYMEIYGLSKEELLKKNKEVNLFKAIYNLSYDLCCVPVEIGIVEIEKYLRGEELDV